MAMEYFCAYHSYLAAMELLTDEEKGRLFDALLRYSSTGTAPDLSGNERFVFPTMRDQIDRDAKKYAAKCAKNRKNIMQRYTNVRDCNPSYTNATKEKEKEKEKTKEKEKEKEKAKENIGGSKGEPPADKPPRTRFVPPGEDETVMFFRENGSSKEEAEAFRDYYQANGWKVGGRASMKDWRAAARNWIRRAGSYGTAQKAEQTPTAWDTLDKAAERIEKGDFSFMEV